MITKHQRSAGNAIGLLMHIQVPWILVLTYLVGVGLELTLPSYPGREPPFGIEVAGAVLFVIGAALASCGLVIFRKARTTTVPGRAPSNRSPGGRIASAETRCTWAWSSRIRVKLGF